MQYSVLHVKHKTKLAVLLWLQLAARAATAAFATASSFAIAAETAAAAASDLAPQQPDWPAEVQQLHEIACQPHERCALALANCENSVENALNWLLTIGSEGGEPLGDTTDESAEALAAAEAVAAVHAADMRDGIAAQEQAVVLATPHPVPEHMAEAGAEQEGAESGGGAQEQEWMQQHEQI